MDEHIAHLIRQIPGLDGADVRVTPLVGGITNQNYRLDSGQETLVLRVGGKGTQLLGIDREREYKCTSIAAQLGVGAPVVHFLGSDDALVTRFIPGTGVTPEIAAQPDTLRRIVTAIQCYHAGPAFPGTFSPFATVRSYYQLALKHGVTFPEELPEVFALMQRIEQAVLPVQQIRPCHNDLLAGNFIDDGRQVWIIDWEYAGMGDLFFDLGNFAVNQELDPARCELLLQAYFGEVREADLAHLHLMRLSSDLREAFWGFLQLLQYPRTDRKKREMSSSPAEVQDTTANPKMSIDCTPGISELDFDYREYAEQHLQRFLQHIDTEPFEQWLGEVVV